MYLDRDFEGFKADLLTTAELFGESLSAARILAYFEALADLPLVAVSAALTQARRTLRFFPKPVEIREVLVGSVEDRAREAWRRVLGALEHVGTYESVDFGDPVTHAVLEALGGWSQAWAWDRAEGPELLGLERDFVSLYRLYAERGSGRTPPAALLGQHALHNRQLGAALRGEIPAEAAVGLDPGGYPGARRAMGPVSDRPALEPPRAD